MINLEDTYTETFEKSATFFRNIHWEKLGLTFLKQEMVLWLKTLASGSAKTYTSCLNQLIFAGFLDPLMPLKQFAFLNHESIIDKIKGHPHWEEANKQTKAAAYIGFTRYLARKYPLFIRKAIPSREVASRTFFPLRKTTAYEALNQAQWKKWLSELKELNFRDYLIGKMLLQGAKRISEVLSSEINQVRWENKTIYFKQAKTKGMYIDTIITYPSCFLAELKTYLNGRRDGYIFITSSGRPVLARHVQNTFVRAGEHAGIPFRVSPHVLRVTAITYLRQQGYPDHAISKISGHSHSAMIAYYDKTSKEKNPSQEVSLI
jgi:integrase